jgi:hypothetical protein
MCQRGGYDCGSLPITQCHVTKSGGVVIEADPSSSSSSSAAAAASSLIVMCHRGPRQWGERIVAGRWVSLTQDGRFSRSESIDKCAQ